MSWRPSERNFDLYNGLRLPSDVQFSGKYFADNCDASRPYQISQRTLEGLNDLGGKSELRI